ncbi:Canalicular multispecific organic anion transporter 1 [Homalodisca vitripennis]|nr:Canalicular multispecific organic anion transporter 1 [Homalodisca vitripennis]
MLKINRTALILALTVYLGTVCGFEGALKAAKRLHTEMLSRIIRALPAFFDTTPSGRILSRLSSDTYTTDFTLPEILRMWQLCSLRVWSRLEWMC